jgi:hypothetical protein
LALFINACGEKTILVQIFKLEIGASQSDSPREQMKKMSEPGFIGL